MVVAGPLTIRGSGTGCFYQEENEDTVDQRVLSILTGQLVRILWSDGPVLTSQLLRVGVVVRGGSPVLTGQLSMRVGRCPGHRGRYRLPIFTCQLGRV